MVRDEKMPRTFEKFLSKGEEPFTAHTTIVKTPGALVWPTKSDKILFSFEIDE